LLGDGRREFLSDQRNQLQVAVVEVLQHHALDAGVLVRAEPRRRLVDRAEDRRFATGRLVLVGIDALASAFQPPRMRSRASASSLPIAQPVISESGIGSRPSRSQARASFSRRSTHSAGVAITVLYSSAHVAAGRPCRRDLAAPTIRCGRGPVAPVAAHRFDLLLEPREARLHLGEREAERLVLGLHPAGSHSERHAATRDLVRSHRAFASTAGGRNVTGETSVPSSIVEVRAARAGITAQASSAARPGSVCDR
jgi:hypothetical protein